VFSSSSIPKDLITVHIRWGDKGKEMKLVSAQEYIDAIDQILHLRKKGSTSTSTSTANIFLATEDPDAVREFTSLISSTRNNWTVWIDAYFHDMLPHRIKKYNGNPQMSKELGGHPGLVAMSSLLVAMEANDFVLTTASNWSRLLNELRKNVLDPNCGNCTQMIDLRPGEW
jgi:hypothetical protein